MGPPMPRQEGDADAVQPPGQDNVRGCPQGILSLCQCASSNPLNAYSRDLPMIAMRLSVICRLSIAQCFDKLRACLSKANA